MSGKSAPVFVPVAFPESQALATLAAVRTVFATGGLERLGPEGEEARGELARAMMTLAEAIDARRAKDKAA